MTSPTDDSRGPTDKQLGRKDAALREVMGFDVEALAARSQLDVNLILAIEAGTHPANVDELSDLVFALGVTSRRSTAGDRELHVVAPEDHRQAGSFALALLCVSLLASVR